MMRRSLARAAVVAAGLCLWCGGRSLVGAATAGPSTAGPSKAKAAELPPLVIRGVSAPSIGVDFGTGTYPTSGSSTNVLGDATTATASTADGVAAIPLPPSAYPGMVGLATAALSVWRYRRRRR